MKEGKPDEILEVLQSEVREIRDANFAWQDKRILTLFRKIMNKQTNRKYSHIYFTLTLINSDFIEANYDKSKVIRNLTKTCCTYSGRDITTVLKVMQNLRKWELIDYGRQRDKTGQTIGSYLFMFKFVPEYHIPLIIGGLRESELKEDVHIMIDPNMGEPQCINNKSTISKDIVRTFGKSSNKKQERMVRTKSPYKQKENPPDNLSNGRHWAIEFWNTVNPDSPKHRNPDTNTYKQAAKMFDQMMIGTFISRRKKLQQFVKEFHLPKEYLTLKWKKGEIKQALRQLGWMYTDENKGYKPYRGGLGSLLFNPYSQKEFYSHFLYMAWHYKKLKAKQIKLNTDDDKEGSPEIFVI